MLHSSTIYSICTFGTLLYFHFAGHEPKIMYYVSPDSVVFLYSSIVLLIPMLGRCIQDMYYFLSMYFVFCWQYLYIQTSSCHLPYCVPFWVRLPLYFILWDYSVYCLIVTTEQLSEPMTNGWYMASLTLFDLYPDCSWHINLRGVTVQSPRFLLLLGFILFWLWSQSRSPMFLKVSIGYLSWVRTILKMLSKILQRFFFLVAVFFLRLFVWLLICQLLQWPDGRPSTWAR